MSLLLSRDAALSARKSLSSQIFQESKSPTSPSHLSSLKAASEKAGAEGSSLGQLADSLDEQLQGLISQLPNLLSDSVPPGSSSADNVVVKMVGSTSALPIALGWSPSFVPRWHDDVLSSLSSGSWAPQRASSLSGSRFSCLSGSAARLERALGSFMVDLHSVEHGYEEWSVPVIVGRSALRGTGQLPKFEGDLFRISRESHTCNGEDAFLVPTAEVCLTNLHLGELFQDPAGELPKRYVALTNCFRAEAGVAGRDTRGLIRAHQFGKVEVVKITTQETSQ